MLIDLVSFRESSYRTVAVALAVMFLTSAAIAVPPVIQIPRIDAPPKLSDFEAMHPSSRLSMSMLKVSGFVAREPADGAEPTQNTDVYLAFDDRNLYAVFICWDK